MKTKVIFKIMGGTVIALFPELAGDNNPYKTCQSYEHIGQYGAASVELSSLKAANYEEYLPLWAELTNVVGYDLQIVKRFSRKMLQERIAQCDL
jgi:hypothetical protein